MDFEVMTPGLNFPQACRDFSSVKEMPETRGRGVGGGVSKTRAGFTLIEMLVASAVLVLILAMTLQIVSYTTTLTTRTRSRIDAFQESRAGFELMTRTISQAMLNTYWDYADSNGYPKSSSAYNGKPVSYLRQSELQFVSGQANGIIDVNNAGMKCTTHAIFFQAPLGYSSGQVSTTALPNMLNACGFFVEFSGDAGDRPAFLATSGAQTVLPLRYRFRLKQFIQPTESLGIYKFTNDASPSELNYWYNNPLQGVDAFNQRTSVTVPKVVTAENVIALVILPQRSPNYPAPSGAPVELAPQYNYDSRLWAPPTNDRSSLGYATRNQLPPNVQVTMVAIDEPSAARLQLQNGTQMPDLGLGNLFQQASNDPTTGSFDKYQADLTTLQNTLISQHINYRVFSTNVGILQAKWSDQ
jgi:uncharacterized protein (TIGR02599 family)